MPTPTIDSLSQADWLKTGARKRVQEQFARKHGADYARVSRAQAKALLKARHFKNQSGYVLRVARNGELRWSSVAVCEAMHAAGARGINLRIAPDASGTLVQNLDFLHPAPVTAAKSAFQTLQDKGFEMVGIPRIVPHLPSPSPQLSPVSAVRQISFHLLSPDKERHVIQVSASPAPAAPPAPTTPPTPSDEEGS